MKPNTRPIDPDEGLAMRPSYRFLRLTRNPDAPIPTRFEPTVKAVGDVVI